MEINKIYFVCPKFLYKNELFNLESEHNWDNALYPFYLLKKLLAGKGIELNTFDYYNQQDTNYALLFQDFTRITPKIIKKHPLVKKFLFVYESPIKIPANQNKDNAQYFEKIFTWDTSVINNPSIDSGQTKKYFQLSYTRKFPETLTADPKIKNKLLTGFFGYKLQTHPLELYSERIEAIRYFEQHHPKDFDLYGYGWEEHYFQDSLFHLNRISFLKKFFKPNFPSYKGFVKNKADVYKYSKFAICYENAVYPNYITEKILDCFLGGTVPIYIGAPNITNFIPKETFIDKRDFKTYDELYNFIKNMPQEKYNGYLNVIKNFVESEKSYPFKAECFAKTLTEEIIKSFS